jgi:hypothetical protein
MLDSIRSEPHCICRCWMAGQSNCLASEDAGQPEWRAVLYPQMLDGRRIELHCIRKCWTADRRCCVVFEDAERQATSVGQHSQMLAGRSGSCERYRSKRTGGHTGAPGATPFRSRSDQGPTAGRSVWQDREPPSTFRRHGNTCRRVGRIVE